MARTLTFTLGERSIACGVDKLDRKKLYGYRRRQVLDDQNRACKLGLLCEDGRSLLGPGGVGLAYLDDSGAWVDRTQLKALGPDGQPLPLIPSSYDGPIRLGEKVSEEELAALAVRDVLQLADEGGALRGAIGEDIYRFTYCYRADYAGETAYLIAAAEGVFALIGQPAPYRFVGLDLGEAAGEGDEGEELAEDDDLDFGMM